MKLVLIEHLACWSPPKSALPKPFRKFARGKIELLACAQPLQNTLFDRLRYVLIDLSKVRLHNVSKLLLLIT